MRGFSLVEMLISLVILCCALLSAGQLLFSAMSSGSLGRSKGAAAVIAQNELEGLAGVYRQEPSAPALAIGSHGPRMTELINPEDGNTLNRFSIVWDVSPVPDPRSNTPAGLKLVTVTVTPVSSGVHANSRPLMNKILSVSTILSPKMP